MRKVIFLFIFFPFSLLDAQIYKDPKAPAEERVKDVLSKMTLEEKIDYIGGKNSFYIRSIERLGLPEIKMTDGPVGTRNDGKTTAYPASILSSATWDTTLVNQLGIALGKDSRARGVHILLAPGVNIYRAPMNGRNFEYLGEDPFLSSRMAVNYIRGVQSQGVVATVKHFAANNQEWDRNRVSSDMDERTLQEIYLPAFKAAVQQGKAGAVMNSYNLINGEHATQNNHLNNELLKGAWGFQGVLMSDWDATYDGVAAAKGGLDLEMPSAKFMNKENLLPAIKNGTLKESVIDDKVARILRMIFRFGFYDHIQLDASLPKDNPENAKVALNLARNGIVLLKNQDNVLPLKVSEIKSIAVIGPNANAYVAGGGSSYTLPFHFVTVLQGIKNMAPGAKVTYIPGLPQLSELAQQSEFFTQAGQNISGLNAEYFTNQNLEGNPEVTVVEKNVNHVWGGAPEVKGIPEDHFSVRWTGVIRPAKSGSYKFSVKGDDGYRLWINNQLLLNEWHDQGSNLKSEIIQLEAGKEYSVKLEYYENAGSADICFAWYPEAVSFEPATKAAADADVAIICAGFDNSSEGEGSDRTFELPEFQDSLINAVAKVNSNTIVVLNAGGNVYMEKWLPQVKGLIHAWYPGQEGGTALAEIIFGEVNPSGKLPASFEKKWSDNPAYNNYHAINGSKKVQYNEGVFIGYRYYDSQHTEPMFPFGYGLSYTSFAYSNIKVSPVASGKSPKFVVSFDVKNTGNYDGAEAAQVYVHDVSNPADRPYKELKGFSKVFLKKGETRRITAELDSNAFSYFKSRENKFGYDAGNFEILVGASSKDIRLKSTITLK